MPAALTVVMLLSLASNPTAPTESKPKLLVLELTAPAALDPTIAKTLSEAVTAEVSRRGYFEVLSTGDIQTILGVERQRQLLGCSEGSSSCIAELAGAMGAQLTLSGSIGTLGDTFQLTLQTLDSIKGQTVGRSMRVTHSAETLRALLPSAVAEATGIPAPPGRSRVLPYSLLGVGAAAVVGGGVLGYQALSADTALRNELELGQQGNAALSTGATYDTRASQIAQQRGISLALLCTGAALLVAGIVFMPRSADETQIALVPTLSGAALVGVFP